MGPAHTGGRCPVSSSRKRTAVVGGEFRPPVERPSSRDQSADTRRKQFFQRRTITKLLVGWLLAVPVPNMPALFAKVDTGLKPWAGNPLLSSSARSEVAAGNERSSRAAGRNQENGWRIGPYLLVAGSPSLEVATSKESKQALNETRLRPEAKLCNSPCDGARKQGSPPTTDLARTAVIKAPELAKQPRAHAGRLNTAPSVVDKRSAAFLVGESTGRIAPTGGRLVQARPLSGHEKPREPRAAHRLTRLTSCSGAPPAREAEPVGSTPAHQNCPRLLGAARDWSATPAGTVFVVCRVASSGPLRRAGPKRPCRTPPPRAGHCFGASRAAQSLTSVPPASTQTSASGVAADHCRDRVSPHPDRRRGGALDVDLSSRSTGRRAGAARCQPGGGEKSSPSRKARRDGDGSSEVAEEARPAGIPSGRHLRDGDALR